MTVSLHQIAGMLLFLTQAALHNQLLASQLDLLSRRLFQMKLPTKVASITS